MFSAAYLGSTEKTNPIGVWPSHAGSISLQLPASIPLFIAVFQGSVISKNQKSTDYKLNIHEWALI